MIKQEITFDRFIRWVIIALIVCAVFLSVNYLRSALLPFFIAWFLAYLLFPLVKLIEKYLFIRIRAVSIIITISLVCIILTGIVMAIIPPMLEQLERLEQIVGNYIQTKAHISNIPEAVNSYIHTYRNEIQAFVNTDDFSQLVKDSAPRIMKFVTGTFNAVYSVIGSCIVLLYTFFILLNYEKLSKAWIKIFPSENRTFWQELMNDVEHAMNSYIRGQSMVALIMGILFCIGFTIIGFPMAIGLGILIGILDLVPYLHTFALVPTAFLALMKAADTGENFWVIFASAVAVFCVVQVIIDMIVTPKVMGKAMGMNPAILLLALSIWGTLLGFIGLIIALPLTTIIIAYWQRYISK